MSRETILSVEARRANNKIAFVVLAMEKTAWLHKEEEIPYCRLNGIILDLVDELPNSEMHREPGGSFLYRRIGGFTTRLMGDFAAKVLRVFGDGVRCVYPDASKVITLLGKRRTFTII